jgi:hypothetical protein
VFAVQALSLSVDDGILPLGGKISVLVVYVAEIPAKPMPGEE